MAKRLENEMYDDDGDNYEEEDDSSSFRRWGIIAGIGVAVLCVGLLVVLWFGREVFMAPIAQWIASDTPIPTQTLPPTATFTQFPTATATQPPAETPTATPVKQPPPEIMAQAVPPPVLTENFSDNVRAWTGLGDNSEFLIQENRLILRSNQPGQPAVSYCAGDCGPYKDAYYYEAEVMDERASGFGYGLLFAINDQKNSYYAYKIRASTGEYGLFKLVSGAWSPLIDWTKSPMLLPSPQYNLLGASVRDKNIDLFVNGARLGSAVDQQPLPEGRIGFMVDQDGVRLFAGNVQVFQLQQTTPTPLGQIASPMAPPGLPTFTPGLPTAAVKFTSTPTPVGSCPRGTPEDTWILVITNVNQTTTEILINGVSYRIKEFIEYFYLNLDTNYTIEIGSKTREYNFPACKIVYLKIR